MEISKLGTFGLRSHIIEAVEGKRQPSTLLGLTDDAAVIAPIEGERHLVVSKLMLEGIHFDLVYFPLQYLGFKAVTNVVAEIIGMGGTPRQLTLAVGLSQRFKVEDADRLMLGVKDALALYGIDLAGLDISSSYTGLTIATTAVGSVAEGEEVRRSGAQKNDLICVSGNVGAAYMGLQLLIREKTAYDGREDFHPQFEGREYILQRQMKPIARLDVLRQLQSNGIKPNAMTNVSDGLASDLMQICHSSGVGARIYEQRLPIDHETAGMADDFGLSTTLVGMNGGDDFELLFTVPLGYKDMLDGLEDVRQIGFVTDEADGIRLVSSGGSETTIVAQGYNKE
ncbi:MAG: thiamine-phosphate kinase [Porphyromonas sp.]|nr:thiamine-phosphate kinase [Porphyromonas sp.]